MALTKEISQLQPTALANDILSEVMRFRRTAGPETQCSTLPCLACLAPHRSKVLKAVLEGKPIPFILPAFPGKSPNPRKVLGPLPDMAERQALQFLQNLCDQIQIRYAPGARIILCSDGRVFSDVVGMRDQDVTAYQIELSQMIHEMGLTSISTFNLEELEEFEEIYDEVDFDQMRGLLMKRYGEPLEHLKASVKQGAESQACSADDQEAHRLYCGITRFLFEDSIYPGQEKSRTALQKDARARAYEVIQRSKAWSELIEERFPDAVRLSIHPQSCGSKKLGVRLLEPDHWQTPWHGVAVDIGGRFVLLKRAHAETLSAQLVHQNGRASHYVLNNPSALPQLNGDRHGL